MAKTLSLNIRIEQSLEYLNDYYFQLQKRLIEFKTFDKDQLERLKILTKDDYDKYIKSFTSGDKRGILFNSKTDEENAKKHDIKNIAMLKKRIQLQNHEDIIRHEFELLAASLENIKLKINN